MYRAGGAVSAKAPGKGAFAHDERSSSGAVRTPERGRSWNSQGMGTGLPQASLQRVSLFWGSSRNVPVPGFTKQEAPHQYPIRRRGIFGGSISARMASNTTLNCRSTFPSISSSRSTSSLWVASTSRILTNARTT